MLISRCQLSVEKILWSNHSLFFVFVRWLSTQKMYKWVVVEYWSVVTVHKVFSFHDLSCLLKKSYGEIILFSFKFNIFMFCAPALFTASMLSLLNLPYVNNASLNFIRLLCLRLVFTSDGVRVGVRVGVGAGVVIRSIELMIE